MAQWNHFDSIPNSIVKHCSGEDSEGVAPCQNSSMPGLLFYEASSDSNLKRLCCEHLEVILFGYIFIAYIFTLAGVQ
jgi:hypothetical protein